MIIKPQKLLKTVDIKETNTVTGLTVNELGGRAEYILMGNVLEMHCIDDLEKNKTEMIWYTTYILKTIEGGEQVDYSKRAHEIYDRINQYSTNMVRHMSVMTVQGMILIAYTLDTLDDEDMEEYPSDITTDMGVFSFVYNNSCPDFSELGYTFYEKRGNHYHRVG